MDLNIVNNQEKFLAGKLEGYTLKGAENKFDDKGNPLPVSYTHLTLPTKA